MGRAGDRRARRQLCEEVAGCRNRSGPGVLPARSGLVALCLVLGKWSRRDVGKES